MWQSYDRAPSDRRAQVGEALASRQIQLGSLMKEWDPSGDGAISKMELRQAIKRLLERPGEKVGQLVGKVDVKEVDALFVLWDRDKGGAERGLYAGCERRLNAA